MMLVGLAAGLAVNEVNTDAGDLMLNSSTGIVRPSEDSAIGLGTAAVRWANIYGDNVNTATVGAAASLELEPTADIILDPAGSDVLPGSDSADNFGATGTRWLTGWFDTCYTTDVSATTVTAGTLDSPLLQDAAAITVKASGDSDDYVQFKTVTNIPYIMPVGTPALGFDAEGSDIIDLRLFGGANSNTNYQAIKGYNGTSIQWQIGDEGTSDADFQILNNFADIVLKPNGDTNNYLQFSTLANVPTIIPKGGTVLAVGEASAFTTHLRLYQHATQGDGLTRLQGYNGTRSHWYVGAYSQAGDDITLVNEFGDVYIVSNDANGIIRLQPNDDQGQFVIVSTAANVPSITPSADGIGTVGTDTYTWADVKSVLINGADICLVNGFCFTECNNDGKADVCITTSKPTDLMAQKMGLYKFDTFEDYQASHMIIWCDENLKWNETLYKESCMMVYDETLTEQEFDTYKAEIYQDGQLDFLFDRPNRGSLRDLKSAVDRQAELIAILYGNGVITQEQMQHLRDDF